MTIHIVLTQTPSLLHLHAGRTIMSLSFISEEQNLFISVCSHLLMLLHLCLCQH